MSSAEVDGEPAGPKYEKVRVNETRIRRTYTSVDIAALIQDDLLKQTSRSWKSARDDDRFEIEYGKLPDGVEAQLIVQGLDY